MKQIFFLVCLSLSFLFNVNVSAQDFDVPTFYKFENIEDYGLYRDDAIKAIEWLETTPLNEEMEKRELVNQFLYQWLSGSPSVAIEIHPYVIELSQDNPDFLMVFMGSWAKQQLQFEEQNNLQLNISGIHSIINLYKMGGVAKNQAIENLIKIDKKGGMEKWVQKRIVM